MATPTFSAKSAVVLVVSEKSPIIQGPLAIMAACPDRKLLAAFSYLPPMASRVVYSWSIFWIFSAEEISSGVL